MNRLAARIERRHAGRCKNDRLLLRESLPQLADECRLPRSRAARDEENLPPALHSIERDLQLAIHFDRFALALLRQPPLRSDDVRPWRPARRAIRSVLSRRTIGLPVTRRVSGRS